MAWIIFILFSLLHLATPKSEETDGPLSGHMMPLGSHTKPSQVEERLDIPSAEEFMTKYVFPSRPVVFRGILKDSPMLHKWSDEYVKKAYPDLEVRLEAKTEKEGYVPVGDIGLGRDTLKNFISTYHNMNKYVVSELPTPIWHEVLIPSFMTCGPVSKNFVEIDLWMSGGNTSSLLHKDAFNALNCLFNGTKEWKLFEYKYEKDLYKAFEPGAPYGGFSRINPEAVDMQKYPKIATVPWSLTTVHKGDCLFLPKSMYHQVKSFGSMNTAVAILFSRFDHIKQNQTSFNECPGKFLPLEKIDVDLQYPGTGMMSMGYSELRIVRRALMGMVGKSKESTYRNILEAVSLKDGHPLSVSEKAEKLQTLLENGKPGEQITRNSLKKLPKSALRRASFLIQPFVPSNSYEYEYFQIRPGEIAQLLSILVKVGKGLVKRIDFVNQYQERLWGSEKFGNSFFDDLAGKDSNEVEKKDILENFKFAAKKFDKKELLGDDEDEDGDNEEESDAYIGRNVDLNVQKDSETLENLGRQIIGGNFVDKDGEYSDNERSDDDKDNDEPEYEITQHETEGDANYIGTESNDSQSQKISPSTTIDEKSKDEL